jgi:hypothetical protein
MCLCVSNRWLTRYKTNCQIIASNYVTRSHVRRSYVWQNIWYVVETIERLKKRDFATWKGIFGNWTEA